MTEYLAALLNFSQGRIDYSVDDRKKELELETLDFILLIGPNCTFTISSFETCVIFRIAVTDCRGTRRRDMCEALIGLEVHDLRDSSGNESLALPCLLPSLLSAHGERHHVSI